MHNCFVKTLWFFWYTPRSGISGASVYSIFVNLLRNCHTVPHSGCTSHIPTNSVQGPLPPCPCHHLYFLVLTVSTTLVGVRQGFFVVLKYVTLMMSSVKCLFMCSFTIVYLLYRNVCSSPLLFLNWVAWFYVVEI
jgi:hypothetical protein